MNLTLQYNKLETGAFCLRVANLNSRFVESDTKASWLANHAFIFQHLKESITLLWQYI